MNSDLKAVKGSRSINFQVKNKKTGRMINFYKKGTQAVNPTVKKLISENPNNIDRIPTDFVIDIANKKLVKKYKADGNPTKEFIKVSETTPNSLKFSSKEKLIFDKENKKFYKLNDIVKNNKLVKQFKNYKIINGVLFKKRKNPFKRFGNQIRTNNGLTLRDTFKSSTRPSNINSYLSDVKDMILESDRNVPLYNKKVLFKFGTLFRFIPAKDILYMDETKLETLLDNWEGVMGSDVTTAGGVNLLDIDYLDTTYFALYSSKIRIAGVDFVSIKSKFWKTEQPKSKNNLCLECALIRGLKIKNISSRLRKMMSDKYTDINIGELISFDFLHYYEDELKVNINIYKDSEHYKDGKEEANLIRRSNKQYENSVKLLYKDNHINLIKSKKINITDDKDYKKDYYIKNKENSKDYYIKNRTSLKDYNKKKRKEYRDNEKMSAQKKRIMGLSPALKDKVLKEKNYKTKLLIFDIETVFDKNSDNFLKSYGVSWFVWDVEDEFIYNPEIHTKEPFCYYKRGEGCLEELLKFMISPPEGFKYKPIGFNNSRFDNYALCEVALENGFLTDVFYADGSILKANILNCESAWDASRFLTGMSLERACNNYNTTPKKRKDLINHYEIQCFYEKNGWNGLNNLLDTNDDLVLYNKIDCICLLDLTLKMRKSYLDLFNTDVFEYLTLSSMGYKIFDKTLETQEIYVEKPMTYDEDRFFRDSLTAGRTQSFYGKYDFKMPLAMGDIKSLYPTVMGSYGDNHNPYPIGEYSYTTEEKPLCMGIYRVNLKHQKCIWKNKDLVYKNMKYIKDKYKYDVYREYAPNVIPLREKDKPLNWDYKSEIKDIKLTSVDINVLRWATEDHNCVEIIDGYYWEDTSFDLFTKFLDPPRLEKGKQDELKASRKKLEKELKEEHLVVKRMIELHKEDYNEAKREGCKLVSNALSGKLLEAIHTDVNKKFTSKNFLEIEKDETISELDILDFGGGFSMITGKKKEKDVFTDTQMDKRKPSYLGMFVYSYARELMYKKILGRYITLYMDTDSACVPMIEWDRLCNENKHKNFINTGEYGCIEEEVCDTLVCNDCKNGKVIDKNISYINGLQCRNCKNINADRIIAISPKNYMVENTTSQSFSKRKFKGVRKTDFWLPLKYFGEYGFNEKMKVKGEAVDFIKGLTQDEVRRYREFGCCEKCVVDVLEDKEKRCEDCLKKDRLMNKTYTTEMFEYLERGEKICVFSSMINKIKFKVGTAVEWEFLEGTGGTMNLEQMETILNGLDKKEKKKAIMIKFNCSEKDINDYTKKIQDLLERYDDKNEKDRKRIIDAVMKHHRKYKEETETKLLMNVFKLKQQYLIKII